MSLFFPKFLYKALPGLAVLGAVVLAGVLAYTHYFSSTTIHQLLTENKTLSSAIANLSIEQDIGRARVVKQRVNEDGELETTLRFIQTAHGKPQEIVNEQEFTVRGDVVHFDALIIKFDEQWVRDGKERALYLWRRVYDESTPPESAMAIETVGKLPERYFALTKGLRDAEKALFWDEIWNLGHDPNRLEKYGIRAVYGNAVYLRMVPDRLYHFKINASGQIFPEAGTPI